VPPNKPPSLRKIYNQLVRHQGNVSAAAKDLKMDSNELRRITRRTRGLMDAALEAAEQALDEAESVIHDGLKSPDRQKQLLAASQILRMSPGARRRRW
jgi:biopolymer transport protein ExbB/TolQ